MTDHAPDPRADTLLVALAAKQAPGKISDAVGDLRRLEGDVDATMQTAVVCTGTSWAGAT
jgi:hypothetical protein